MGKVTGSSPVETTIFEYPSPVRFSEPSGLGEILGHLDLYKIHVINFNKHNSSLKKGHKATLISNNFCSDSKLGVVPLTVRWMFLGIVLTCGDYTSDTVEMNEKQLRELLESSWSVPRALDALKEIQVLTYSKIDLFLNRIEKKVKEEKRKEITVGSKITDAEENKKIWMAYANAFRIRYGIDPVRNAKVNGQVASLRKQLGTEQACQVVAFYLTHNDSWYLKNTHSFGYCLSNAETLRTQMMRNQKVTSADVRQFEQQQHFSTQIERIQKGQIK